MLNWKLLTAFEAAARHRNFTLAARELNVQQPSISRRVAELEAELGVELITRTRPAATLTADGELLFGSISSGVSQVRSAMDQIRSRPDRDTVVVNTTIGFASCYLLQRLASFRSANPEISVEIVSRDQNETYKSAQADILIVFDNPENLPGVRRRKVFGEQLVPVAKPGVFPSVDDAICAITELPLLHLSAGVHARDWETYLSGTGVRVPPARSDQRFTSFMVYLQVALNGEGVILGWERLLQNHFDIGQLERIANRTVETDRGYFACLTQRAEQNEPAQKLWDWLARLS